MKSNYPRPWYQEYGTMSDYIFMMHIGAKIGDVFILQPYPVSILTKLLHQYFGLAPIFFVWIPRLLLKKSNTQIEFSFSPITLKNIYTIAILPSSKSSHRIPDFLPPYHI